MGRENPKQEKKNVETSVRERTLEVKDESGETSLQKRTSIFVFDYEAVVDHVFERVEVSTVATDMTGCSTSCGIFNGLSVRKNIGQDVKKPLEQFDLWV